MKAKSLNALRKPAAKGPAGVDFKTMLRHAGLDRERRAGKVLVKNLKFGVSRTLGIPKAIANTYSKDSPTFRATYSKYTTFIEFLPKKGHLRVSCSCSDHMYRWEWALAQKLASYVTYSNGEASASTNPKGLPGCCIAGSQSVLTRNGVKAMRDLTIGDDVFTLMGYCPVTSAGLTGVQVNTLNIHTDAGSLECTPDHRLLVLNETDHPQWVEAAVAVGSGLPLLKWCTVSSRCIKAKVLSVDSSVSDVYDITVPVAEHFTANGFVVHNCKHVIALHWAVEARGFLEEK